MPKISRSGDDRRRKPQPSNKDLRRGSRSGVSKAANFAAEYRRWRRRRYVAAALVALGLGVIFTHLYVHLRSIQWLPTTGMQDLLTGYPLGGALIILGLALLPRL